METGKSEARRRRGAVRLHAGSPRPDRGRLRARKLAHGCAGEPDYPRYDRAEDARGRRRRRGGRRRRSHAPYDYSLVQWRERRTGRDDVVLERYGSEHYHRTDRLRRVDALTGLRFWPKGPPRVVFRQRPLHRRILRRRGRVFRRRRILRRLRRRFRRRRRLRRLVAAPALPYRALLRFRAYHRVAELAEEGFGKLRHIAQRLVDAELVVAVHVRLREQPDEFRPFGAGPNLRPTHEEALFGRKAVDDAARMLRLPFLERLVRDRESAQIRDLLALDLFADLVYARQRLQCIPLVDDALRARVEPRRIRRRPPVGQVSNRVELAAGVVEAVRRFVADDGADAAVVDGHVRVFIEERRLQDARRKDDLVDGRIRSEE